MSARNREEVACLAAKIPLPILVGYARRMRLLSRRLSSADPVGLLATHETMDADLEALHTTAQTVRPIR